MKLTADHPLVRASNSCPLCNGPKPVGLVACWPCYHETNMRYGNATSEAMINHVEATIRKTGHPLGDRLQPVYVELDAQGPHITTTPTRGTLNFSRSH